MATIMDIGIDTQNTGMYHPKTKNRWKAVFLNLGGPRNKPSASSTDNVPVSQNAITMQSVTFQRPHLTFDEVALHRYNSVGYVASKHSWSECSISLEDDVTSYAAQLLQSQLERQQYLVGSTGSGGAANLLGTAATASEYKFSCELDMLDGGTEFVERWQLQGCWIKDVNWGDLDYSTGEAIKIDVSLRFDHAVQRFPSVDYGTALGGAGSIT
jgi:hypothetical protein